jgi:hypothetical protein
MKLTRLSGLLYVGFLGMELSYLYILASLLNGPVYALIVMLLLYPLALIFRLALFWSALSHQLRFTLEVALVSLVILLVAGERLVSSLAAGQADVLGIILRIGFCGLTWLMGHAVPYERVNYTTIALRLQAGVLAVLIFSQVSGNALPVFLFFMMAPPALFLARWASSLSRGAAVLRSTNPGHLLLAVASVMLPGMALIILFSPGVAHAIVHWLGDIGEIISDWLMVQQKAAASPSTKFNFNFSCSLRPEEAVPSPPPPTQTLPTQSGVPPWVSTLIFWLIAFAIFLAILAFIAFTLRRRKARRKAHPVEPVRFQTQKVSLNMLRSLISFFPQLLKKLWLWLTLLFQRWRKRPEPSEEALISIRALYRNLLRWAARQGVARVPSQTPLEHLVLLKQRFPQQQDDLKQITEMYLLARYSRKPISHEEFDRVRKAWQRAVAY